MFLAVAGAVIGGTSLFGGQGSVIGAFIGVAVLVILRTGFSIIGVSAFTFDQGGALYFQEGTFHHSQIETPYGPRRCVNAGRRASFRFRCGPRDQPRRRDADLTLR